MDDRRDAEDNKGVDMMGKKAGKSKRSAKIGTVVSIVLCIMLVPVIVINLILITGTYMNPDEIPGIFGMKPVIVLSGSMEPEFSPGDLIFVKKAKDTDGLKEGEVICYLLSGKAITHRIEKVTLNENGGVSYITRGDANNTEDLKEVLPEQVQGVYTGIRWAGIGNIALFMQSTTGMLLLIVCPLALFIILDLLGRIRSDKKEKNRTAELEAELEALREQQERDSPAAKG
ncbi:signal peptidase I [Lacrimispora sp. NSJ-141]|uniref:Signal peptidase I n=1 Tax=Lientehia hominis TaxID=2897778 RepID=A0AAP2W9D6_9FIRM|nr:signal peptidase I [Lientehia hominis]MCD2493255.1 signal peptidase I [Lientehia hominis]